MTDKGILLVSSSSSLPAPRKLCFSLGWFACQQDNLITCGRIIFWMGGMCDYFGGDRDHDPDPGIFSGIIPPEFLPLRDRNNIVRILRLAVSECF